MKKKSTTALTSYSVFMGVDISKSWFDIVISIPTKPLLLHRRFSNNKTGLKAMTQWLKKYIDRPQDQWLFCMEATGLYTRPLVHFLMAKSWAVWVASALDIKRSMGLSRAKSDKADAHTIAAYAAKNQDQCRLVTLSQQNVEKLQDLEASRNRLIKSKKAINVAIKELLAIDPKNGKMVEKANRKALKGIEESIKQIETFIQQIIEEDPQLKELFDLAISVKSVGKVLALKLLIATHGFTRMMDPRKLACHAGVAPFPFQSGSSINGANRVSKFADHSLKAVLHMAAVSATARNPELQQYFQRKIAEGKHKMSVINAIRNKILHRVIAVVKRGYPYIEFSPDFT